jgi:hypothetical protein
VDLALSDNWRGLTEIRPGGKEQPDFALELIIRFQPIMSTGIFQIKQ